MIVIKLDSNYLPVADVAGYFSFIWTERHLPAGDFELKTTDITRTVKLLPLESLISHVDTPEVMIVETHTIEFDENEGTDVLTVTGRSFETFYENRIARPWDTGTGSFLPLHTTDSGNNDAGSEDSLPYVFESLTTSDTLHYLMSNWSELSDEYGNYGGDAKYFGGAIYKYSVRDDVPTREEVDTQEIAMGTIYERMLELGELADIGFRNVRPHFDGESEKTDLLLTRIYAGKDRTESVILSTGADHFVTGSYVNTIVGSKNATGAFSYYRSTEYALDNKTGRFKRVGFLDATNYKQKVYSSAEIRMLTTKSKAYVKKRRPKFIFSGKVAPTIPYVYGKHYRLGDIVRVKGDYEVDQKMRVMEYIRTQDSSGDTAYPTLEVV